MERICTLCGGLIAAALLSTPALADDVDHAHEHPHDTHTPTETIVVTQTPLEHESDEIALPVDVLDRRDILENLGPTIGDTLSRRPGIATTGFAGGASRPVIRGQNAFRTEVVEDGLATQDVSRESPDHGIPLNPLTAQRIEVVRGAATLRYGGGATGGVVNAITDRVPQKAREGASGEVYGAIDTVSEGRSAAFLLDGGLDFYDGPGSVAWHVDGLLRRSDDYELPDSGDRQQGTFADPTAVSAGVSYFLDRGRVGFSYSRFENDYGIPEEDEDVEIDMKVDRYRFEVDFEKPIEFIREVRVRGAYSDYRHDEIAEGDVGQTYDNDQFDGRMEILHEEVGGFLGALGIQGRSRDFEGGGEATEFLADTDTRMVALYLFEERPIVDDLNAEIGFRVESTEVKGTPFGRTSRRDRDFVPISGSLGLVYDLGESWNFGLTGSATQRAPAEVELFARGAHEATQTFEIGDPDLDEETAYSAELRARGDFERFHVEAAAFYTWYDDYIVGALTGRSRDEGGALVGAGDPDALAELVFDSRDAVFYGTELLARADLWECEFGMFGVDGRFDFVRARFDDSRSNKDLPRITPIRWGGGLFFRGDWVRARVGFTRTEEQNDTSTFESTTNDFTFLEASVTFQLAMLDDRLPVELSVIGNNLTDEKARNHVAFNKEEVRLPGRDVRVAIRARF